MEMVKEVMETELIYRVMKVLLFGQDQNNKL